MPERPVSTPGPSEPTITRVPAESALVDVLGGCSRHEIRIREHGFIALVDAMPRLVPRGQSADFAVVQAARVSYGQGTKKVSEDRGLIRYLLRHRHTTPFEMLEFKFHVSMPIFVARQWIRHRTANVNEYSGRYSIMPDHFYTPGLEEVRKQSRANRQGGEERFVGEATERRSDGATKGGGPEATERRSDGATKGGGPEATERRSDEATKGGGPEATERRSDGATKGGQVPGLGTQDAAPSTQHAAPGTTPPDDLRTAQDFLEYLRAAEALYTRYLSLTERGVSRELARIGLPVSVYTQWYWKCDLHNILRFLSLRMDAHSQVEIREYADAMFALLEPIVPITMEAWRDYELEAMHLSRLEVQALRARSPRLDTHNKREQAEWDAKRARFGL